MENQKAYEFCMEDMRGNEVRLEKYKGKKTLISFFRYAACPFCNLRLQELIYQEKDWSAKGLNIITLFESPKESMLKYSGNKSAPFPIIPDPQRTVYEKYGVVHSSKLGMVKGMTLKMPRLMKAMSQGYFPGKPEGNAALMPADFLIDEDLTIQLAYYGKDIGDHLSNRVIEQWLDEECNAEQKESRL